jgi:hypothetical protein
MCYIYIYQNSVTAVEHVKLEASAAEEQNLLYEQSDLRIEVVELTRLAAIKVFYCILFSKLITCIGNFFSLKKIC